MEARVSIRRIDQFLRLPEAPATVLRRKAPPPPPVPLDPPAGNGSGNGDGGEDGDGRCSSGSSGSSSSSSSSSSSVGGRSGGRVNEVGGRGVCESMARLEPVVIFALEERFEWELRGRAGGDTASSTTAAMSRHTGSGKDKDNAFSAAAAAAAEGEEEQEKTSVGGGRRRRRRNDESGTGNEEKEARCLTNNEGGGEGGGKGDDGMEQQGHTFALTARNLTARRGELVGVVGTVGCGKSVSKWVPIGIERYSKWVHECEYASEYCVLNG